MGPMGALSPLTGRDVFENPLESWGFGCFFSEISKILKINFQNPKKKQYFGKFRKIGFWENQPHHLQKSDLDDEEISENFSKENFWWQFYLCKTLLQNGFWPYWILMFLPCSRTASKKSHFSATVCCTLCMGSARWQYERERVLG